MQSGAAWFGQVRCGLEQSGPADGANRHGATVRPVQLDEVLPGAVLSGADGDDGCGAVWFYLVWSRVVGCSVDMCGVAWCFPVRLLVSIGVVQLGGARSGVTALGHWMLSLWPSSLPTFRVVWHDPMQLAVRPVQTSQIWSRDYVTGAAS